MVAALGAVPVAQEACRRDRSGSRDGGECQGDRGWVFGRGARVRLLVGLRGWGLGVGPWTLGIEGSGGGGGVWGAMGGKKRG